MDPGTASHGDPAPPQQDPREKFYRHFQQECTEIQEKIGALEGYSIVGGEKQDAIDHVLASITRLSNEVSDSTEFIPAHDQATYSRVSSTSHLIIWLCNSYV